jgi:hypothetical protein
MEYIIEEGNIILLAVMIKPNCPPVEFTEERFNDWNPALEIHPDGLEEHQPTFIKNEKCKDWPEWHDYEPYEKKILRDQAGINRTSEFQVGFDPLVPLARMVRTWAPVQGSIRESVCDHHPAWIILSCMFFDTRFSTFLFLRQKQKYLPHWRRTCLAFLPNEFHRTDARQMDGSTDLGPQLKRQRQRQRQNLCTYFEVVGLGCRSCSRWKATACGAHQTSRSNGEIPIPNLQVL